MRFIDRSNRLRIRRTYRRRKREVEIAAIEVEDGIEKHFFKRLNSLASVRRFVIGWVGLLVLLVGSVGLQARGLSQYYQKIAPIEGGTLREGMVGTFSGANPLYATNTVDSSVSKLIFSGLFMYDKSNQLVPDLADKYDSDVNGQVYKVLLRHNIKWHDGTPLTADDVVFTYKTIQNPDAKSPLLSSWQGVDITKIDDYTISFALPSAFAAFPYSLTNGIVPKHILGSVPATQLRSIPFNTTAPVGTGPFKWSSVEVSGDTRETRSEQIELKHNLYYHLGEPKIDLYVLKTYRDESAMVKAFENHELTAIVGASKLPDESIKDQTIASYNVPMSGSVMMFLNNSCDILKDTQVRQALALATNRSELLARLGFTVLATQGPLLKGQIGYDPAIGQKDFSLGEAKQLLDNIGWRVPEGGTIRTKDGKKLSLRFRTQNVSEYVLLSQLVQKQWQALGVELDVKYHPEEDMQADVLTRHDYDVLLYGISIGQDPDVFAYWHSTQADIRSANRLNFSEYKNKVADKALEAGRTRTDPAVRALKYKPFLQVWQADVPAIALYQPRFLYITRNELVGFDAQRLNGAVERLNGIQKWTVLQDRVIK